MDHAEVVERLNRIISPGFYPPGKYFENSVLLEGQRDVHQEFGVKVHMSFLGEVPNADELAKMIIVLTQTAATPDSPITLEHVRLERQTAEHLIHGVIQEFEKRTKVKVREIHFAYGNGGHITLDIQI